MFSQTQRRRFRIAWLIVTSALPVGASFAIFQTQPAAALTVQVTNCSGALLVPGSFPYAVAHAASGETIDFALSPTCSRITETSGAITIAADLTIEGPGARTLAVSGGEANTVFLVDRGVTATISGLTIEDGTSYAGGGISNSGTLTVTNSTLSHNGKSASLGGGIYNYLGMLTVTNSKLSDNGSRSPDLYGGGIFNAGGKVTVRDSVLSGNTGSGAGGGIANNGGTLTVIGSTLSGNAGGLGGGIEGNGTVTVTVSKLSGNRAIAGAGIFVNSGTLRVTDSTLSDNRATGGTNTGGGGGIYSNGAVQVTDSLLSGNSAADGGGGISNGETGNFTVTNSTLSGNHAEGDTAGGGIYNFGFKLVVFHSTLSRNTAPSKSGGGIYTRHGTTTLVATIVANSGDALDCDVAAGSLVDGGYNLDDDGSCGFSSANHSLSDTPAGLALSLTNNGGPTLSFALRSHSAAINQVTLASDCIGNDQHRVVWPTPCDLGVIQFLSATNSSVSTIAASLLSPFQAFKPIKTVVVDAGIAAGAVLLIAFPSQIFNFTFEENYEEIRESLHRLVPRRSKRAVPRERRDWTTNRISFAVVVLIGSLLASLNDPHFGVHLQSLITYLAVVGSITLGAAIPGVVTFAYHRRRFGAAEVGVKALPAGLAIAAGCVLVSRLTGFEPGYLYGVVAGVFFGKELKSNEEGHIVALTTLATLAVAVGAWFAWVPVNEAAGQHGAFVGLVFLDDLLAAVFVSGLVGSVVGQIPLQFLPGQLLKAWRRLVWAAVFGVSLFALIQVMIRPHGSQPRHVPMVVTIALFVAFGFGSLAFRDYFERKHRRAKGEPTPPPMKRLHELVTFHVSTTRAEHEQTPDPSAPVGPAPSA